MPRLTVPADQKAGLTKLRQLNSAQLAEFTSALEKAPLRMFYFQVARDVSARVKSIQSEDIESIIESLWQMEFLRFSVEAPREPFMEDMREAMVAAGVAGSDEIAAFMPVVDKLLQTPSLSTAAKARALLTDGNSYCRSRVLTDVRPVFGTEITENPKAAMVVHHLALSYHGSGLEVSDVLVSLDSDDIEDLIGTLQRAQMKQKRLQSLLTEAKVTFLDPD
jgi:hypothetical protein